MIWFLKTVNKISGGKWMKFHQEVLTARQLSVSHNRSQSCTSTTNCDPFNDITDLHHVIPSTTRTRCEKNTVKPQKQTLSHHNSCQPKMARQRSLPRYSKTRFFRDVLGGDWDKPIEERLRNFQRVRLYVSIWVQAVVFGEVTVILIHTYLYG